MKTLISTSLLSLVLCAASAIPDTDPVKANSTVSRELQKQLNKHIVAPAFADDDEMLGTVTASFVVDKNGQLEILQVYSENAELKDYVQGKLNKVKVSDNEDGFWKTTTVNFVFRKEK